MEGELPADRGIEPDPSADGRSEEPRRAPLWRRLAPWALRSALAAVAALLLAILLFRIVPPPTSSVILQARWIGDGPPPQRIWVPWDEISPHLGLAVVAAEDQRFPEHWGLDPDAIQDAIEEARKGDRVRGASTITQQVAKNLFLWPGRSLLRKGLEAGLAVTLEVLWPKRRILEVYLNFAQMGDGIYGAEAASRSYFGKPAAALGPEEAALLAAVLPNPVRFRADRPSDYVRRRQQWILRQMRQLGGTAWLEFDEPEDR